MRVPQPRLLVVVLGLCLLTTSGCAGMRNGSMLGLKIDDPPHLSPFNRSLTQDNSSSTPYQASRPVADPDEAEDELGTQLGEATSSAGEKAVPSEETPQQTIRQRQDFGSLGAPQPGETQLGDTQLGDAIQGLILPGIEPAEEKESSRDQKDTLKSSPLASRQPLALDIRGPRVVLMGEAAKFEVVVRNPHPVAVKDVVIECRFDEGLAFSAAPDRALRQQLGTLGVGEVRTLDLSLETVSPGAHCVAFVVQAADREEIRAERCVSCVEPTVMVELVGPTTRTIGGRLECVLTLVNVTGREVSGVVASITHDTALTPQEASVGAVQLPGHLQWDLGMLQIDERIHMQVEFDCPMTTEQTCIVAEVTGRDIEPLQRELCAVIRPRPILDVNVDDSRDPLTLGETTTYHVTLTNRGLEPLQELTLDAKVTGGLDIVSSTGGLSDVSIGPQPETSTAEVSLLLSERLLPDESRTFTIVARGTAIGTGRLTVTAIDPTHDHRVEVNEPTVVTPRLLDLPSFEEFLRDR